MPYVLGDNVKISFVDSKTNEEVFGYESKLLKYVTQGEINDLAFKIGYYKATLDELIDNKEITTDQGEQINEKIFSIMKKLVALNNELETDLLNTDVINKQFEEFQELKRETNKLIDKKFLKEM